MASRLPTDLRLLDAIYRTYYDDFVAFSDENKNRGTKIWVPIDIHVLAKRFDTDPDMIFGRLYYHLRGKYRQPMGDQVLEFFQMRVGPDHHCVNFPFLASVLADLREEQHRFVVSTRIAALSLVISLISITVAVLA